MDVHGKVDVHASLRGMPTIKEAHGKGVVHGGTNNVLPHIHGPGGTSGTVSGLGIGINGPSVDNLMELGSDSEEMPLPMLDGNKRQRKKRNRVEGLFDDDDKWISGDSELASLATNYFMDLFSSSSPSDASAIFDKVQPCVTVSMNARLLEPFHSEEANRDKSISGVTIGRQRLEVGHFLFADDSILFGEASTNVANNLKLLLELYGNASRQRVNFDKSLIFFSGNVRDPLQREIGALLGVRTTSNPERGQSINHNYTLVSDLIDHQTATWKVDVLLNLFESDLVEQVCSIPLSRTDLDDEIVWRYDGSGLYNVKSGYKLLQEERQSDSGMYAAAPLSISRFFSSMWGVSLPAKVKINMWRVMNNFLPTYANLPARRLNVNNCCPLCGSEVENIQHIMWECVFVKELLGAQGIQVANQHPDVPWMEWMALVFERLNSVQRHALMVTCWVVWHARNKVVHDGVQPSVTNSLSFILASLKEYEMLNLKGVTRPLPIQAKDNAGLILAACSLSHKYVRDPFMAEALACKQAAMLAWELGFSRVVLEGDSRTVIQKCKSRIVDASLISPVIADIKAICSNFMDIVFGHVQREANVVAHTLAQEGKAFDYPMYWIEEASPRTLLAAEKDRAALGSG
ncbi:hypothetical protein V6N13_147522 [Hibiscus sabdariffa]